MEGGIHIPELILTDEFVEGLDDEDFHPDQDCIEQLEISDAESSRFWPIYRDNRTNSSLEQYQKDIGYPFVCLDKVYQQYDLEGWGILPIELLWLLHWLRQHKTINHHAQCWSTTPLLYHRRILFTLLVLYESMNDTDLSSIESLKSPIESNNIFSGATFCLSLIECGLSADISKRFKYLVLTTLKENDFIWISDAFPGDKTASYIVEACGLEKIMPLFGKGIASSELAGILTSDHFISEKRDDQSLNTNESFESEWNQSIQTVLQQGPDIVKSELMNYRILQRSSASQKDYHRAIFFVLCNLINIKNSFYPLKYDEDSPLFTCTIKLP